MAFVTYVYLLRVPLLTWALLMVLPFVAIPSDASLGSLLRGLFDLSDPPETTGPFTWMLGAWAFTLVTIAALMAAAAIAITARLIILDGHERFGTRQVPASPGIELLVRLLPLVAAVGVILGAAVQTWGAVGPVSALIGIVVGFAVFLLVMGPVHDWWWDQVFAKRPPAMLASGPVWLARWIFAWFQWLIRRTPEGFIDPVTKQIRARHAFAVFQLLFTLVLYGLLFLVKWWTFSWGPTRVPTICIVLILATLVCWGLTAISFLLDRYRVPLLVPLIAYGTLMSTFPQGDHFFPSRSRADAEAVAMPRLLSRDVLAGRAGKSAIVVAATGGGIQASAWTARVLAGLQEDSVECRDDFDQALLAISAVSGGSVGAMYIVDAYDNGTLQPMARERAVKAAEASSLDQVAWALAYPDLTWTLAPFLKGLWVWPFHLVNGPFLTIDRGSALEDAWKRTSTLGTATLDDWRRDLQAKRRPAVIFNSTIVETGERMLFGTTTLEASAGPGRVDFGTDARYRNMDVTVVTAARMSATFPYVSPPARIRGDGIFEDQYHLVDGGYYDNYGTATLIEWLDQGLRATGAKPSRILLLEIRSFPIEKPEPPDGRRGWLFEAAHPAETLYAVRGAGQLSHSMVNVELTREAHLEVESLPIEFPAPAADQADDAGPPLSWHLTPQDRGRLQAAWKLPAIKHARNAVHNFLSHANVDDRTDGIASCIR